MKTLTLRRLRPELAREIERKARESRSSLTQAAIALLEKGAGLARKGEREFHDLDRFFGTWSKEEADAFDAAVAEQRRIDPELWK